ncbi:MAG: hypothetical protein VR75_00225 [Hyphomonadaceae bacterium BRH_c29]|nr:MAG: hypothetical protein VR75_00225 [Hyphomonadaceae bacterium BRH_c29]
MSDEFPNSVDWHALSIATLEAGDSKRALRYARRAVEENHCFETVNFLSICLSVEEQTQEELKTLGDAMQLAPPHLNMVHLFYRTGVALSKLGRLPQAEKFLQAASACPDAEPIVWYGYASVLACLGNLPVAQEIFDRNIQVLCGDGKYTHTGIIRLVEQPGSGRHNRKLPFSRKVIRGGRSWPLYEPEAVIFVAGDDVYIRRYLESVASSVQHFADNRFAIHAHIVNPSAEAFGAMDRIRENGIALTQSHETVDVNAMALDFNRAYYSLSRFLMLADVQKLYDVPIIMSDLDQVLNKDPTPFLEAMAGCDTGLVRTPEAAFNLMSYISATLVYVAPTEGGRSFGMRLRQHAFELISEPERVSWHVDQTILAALYLNPKSITFRDIPREMISLSAIPKKDTSPAENIFRTEVASTNLENTGLSQISDLISRHLIT